jgi:predicted nucleic acid-binding protein
VSAFVLDASVTLAVIFEDEFSPYADAVVEVSRREHALTSIVWPLEVANAILTAVRRGRVAEADVSLLVDAIRELSVDIDREAADGSLTHAAVSLGIAHRLSAYDASYLDVAIRLLRPLGGVGAVGEEVGLLCWTDVAPGGSHKPLSVVAGAAITPIVSGHPVSKRPQRRCGQRLTSSLRPAQRPRQSPVRWRVSGLRPKRAETPHRRGAPRSPAVSPLAAPV